MLQESLLSMKQINTLSFHTVLKTGKEWYHPVQNLTFTLVYVKNLWGIKKKGKYWKCTIRKPCPKYKSIIRNISSVEQGHDWSSEKIDRKTTERWLNRRHDHPKNSNKPILLWYNPFNQRVINNIANFCCTSDGDYKPALFWDFTFDFGKSPPYYVLTLSFQNTTLLNKLPKSVL